MVELEEPRALPMTWDTGTRIYLLTTNQLLPAM